MEGVVEMSFFKKLGETMKDTASSLGAKSMDMIEIGKLKLQQGQLETEVQHKKLELGDFVYKAHKQNALPETEAMTKLFIEMQQLESQIAEIEEKIHKETVPPQTDALKGNSDTGAEPVSYCSKCGERIGVGVKFCSNCGEAQK